MKKGNRAILKDNEGNKFIFDNSAFVTLINIMSSQSKPKSKDCSRKNYRTITDIINELSETINYSYETIKKWYYSCSGPNNIDAVYDVAEFFKIKPAEMLIPLEDDNTFYPTREKDKELVEKVFRKTIEIYIDAKNYPCNDNNAYKTKQNDALSQLQNLHMSVNAEALTTSESVRNRLHKLIFQIVYIFDSNWNFQLTFEDWYTDGKTTPPEFFFSDKSYNLYSSRQEYIESEDIFASNYIYDEIELSNKLNLHDIVVIDDKFKGLNDDDNSDIIKQYGYQGELEITPKFIYQQLIVEGLSEVFKKAFEELF